MKKLLSKSFYLLCAGVLLAQASLVALAADEPPVIVDPFATEVAPTINSASSASGTVGSAFSYTITAAGTPTITYTAPGLPAGLSLSGSTISGTPTSAGTSTVTLTATNAQGTDSSVLTITIQAETTEPDPAAEPDPVVPEEEAPPALSLPPAETLPVVPATEPAPEIASVTAPAPTHTAAPAKTASVPIKSLSKSGPEILVLALASALMGAGYRKFKKNK